MPARDRTNELFAFIDSQLTGSHAGAMHAHQLVNRLNSSTDPHRRPLLSASDAQARTSITALSAREKKTEFARRAAAVGRELNLTASKLEKLTKLAKKKSMFDDRPVEIQELTHMVKQDIGKLNGQIKELEQWMNSHHADLGNRQTVEHSSNIVISLQSKLAQTSHSLKDVLEIRSENIRAQQERRDQFAIGSSKSTGTGGILNIMNTDSPLYAPEKSEQSQQQHQQQDFVAISMPLQQLQLVDQTDAYIESRAEAIEGIEKTIADLASIFSQLTTMINAHDDMIKRIDYNVDAMESNVNQGQQQLIKYMSSISSNRWLLAKIFSTLIVFFLVFVLFFA